MEHETTREHYEKYQKMAEKFELSLKGSYWPSKRRLVELYMEDKHLNNISLSRFDRFFELTRTVKGGPKSLAENVCMYKHQLLYGVLGLTPKFKGE
jgi:hypothetical protein